MAKKHELVSDKCLLCGATMVYDKYDFYKCPNCGGEFWPPDDSPREQKKQIDEAFSNQYVSLSQQENRPGKGSGGSSGKRYGAKERMKKPTTRTLYERLN